MEKKEILTILEQYGFVECCLLQTFLHFVARDKVEHCELNYVRHKVYECLLNYDNGSPYFSALRGLAEKTDAALADINY